MNVVGHNDICVQGEAAEFGAMQDGVFRIVSELGVGYDRSGSLIRRVILSRREVLRLADSLRMATLVGSPDR